MPDIAMREKRDCPSFSECYRAQAVKNECRQSYMDFDNGAESCCDDYIPVKPKDNPMLKLVAGSK
jgi:hypothetical protein